MTKEDILDNIKKEKINFIQLQFTDMLGVPKSVEISAKNVDKALNNEVLFDGSSIKGFAKISETDMYLYPDLNTWLVMEWETSAQGKVARLICDVYDSNKKPFENDPRYVLKKALELMQSEQIAQIFNIGFEPEFFFFKLNEYKKSSLEFTDLATYYDINLDSAENIRREIMVELEKIGYTIEVSHHEVANSQHEVNFMYSNALQACDRLQTFKTIVKTIAKKHGLFATFMPKPIKGINGNGMHVNCSMADAQGNNLFFNKSSNNGLSEQALFFINGILKYAKEFTLLTNSSVNSFKRLVPGYEAPCYIAWSEINRSTMIRIPAASGKAKRVEIRSVDSSSNPYLAVAAILQAGVLAIKNKVNSFEPVHRNLFKMTNEERSELNIASLPEDLNQAVAEFKNSELMRSTLGEALFTKLVEYKQKEWDSYKTEITDWEIEHYFNV